MANLFITAGATSGLLSVGLGAMAAHGLKTRLSEYHLGIFQTAAQYEMYHALVLVLIGLLLLRGPSKALRAAGISMMVGTVLFSGSLYALALSGVGILGAVTPFGGVAFMLGWGLLAYAGLKVR